MPTTSSPNQLTAPESALKPWSTGEFDLSAVFRTQVRILDRAQILDDIEREIQRAGKCLESRFVVMLFDLEEYHSTVERSGTKGGDEMVKAMGTRISPHLTPRDAIAHLGGGKVAVLADTSSHLMSAEDFASDIQRDLEPRSRVGIAPVTGAHLTAGEILGNAAHAMGRAGVEGVGAMKFHNWMTELEVQASLEGESPATAT